MHNYVPKIKEALTMRDVLSRYGFEADRANFICCPFHKEKTPSLRVYAKDFHCFGCHAHGDVITFVQKLFGLTFPETLKKINNDFSLNLFGTKTYDEYRKEQYQQKQLQARRERLKAEKTQKEAEYWAAFDEWKRLDDNKRIYAPKTPEDELHPLFVEALQKLPHQRYLLECAEEERSKMNE